MSTGDKLDRIAAAVGDTPVPPPAYAKDFDAVLSSLVSERGGPPAFSPSALAVARKVARMLSDDVGRLDSTGISFLMTLLPAKTAPASQSWDLTGFTDQELREFGRLLALASGRPWPEPARAAGVVGYHGSREPGARLFALAFTVKVTVVPEEDTLPEVEEGVSQFGMPEIE